MKQRTILIQNYHPPGTQGLIRDFKKIGFRVVAPDSNWGRISYYAPNDGLGGELISYEDFVALPPAYVMIACKPQEEDFKKLARSGNHGIILNIAQQHHEYESGISDIMICPDIGLYNSYSSHIKHKLLYFPRPFIESIPTKNIEAAYYGKKIYSYINLPHHWPRGSQAFAEFTSKYDGECEQYGTDASGGALSHAQCHTKMAEAFFTVHLKDAEGYGLTCLESMMIGTPVVGLNSLMAGTTLKAFFLDDTTSILADTIDELVARIDAITLQDYAAMCKACESRVLDLTSDARTVDKLREAIEEDERSAA